MSRKKKDGWLDSTGRRLLFDDVRDGTIPDSMDHATAFSTRPEFIVGETAAEALRLFKGRLTSARKIIYERNTRAETELALLRIDRATRPPPATNHRGEPRWDGSEAQRLLKHDVAIGKHIGISLTQFFQSRLQYQEYQALTISGHVKQEVKTRKFLKQYRSKNSQQDF